MAHHVPEGVVGQVERVGDHVLVRGEDSIGVLAEVSFVEPLPEVLGDAQHFGAQRSRRRGRIRVEPTPSAQLKERRACDLARREHRRDGVDGELAIGRRGILEAEHALCERLVEERERLGARRVRHAAQRWARDEVRRAELLEVVAEFVHRGVEAVPAEFVFKTRRAKPRPVALKVRPHRVTGTLANLGADMRTKEVGVLRVETEFAQHCWELPFEVLDVREARLHGRVHLGRGLCLDDVVEVDIERLKRAAELLRHERCQVAAHRCVEEVGHELLDLGLWHLALKRELARDRGRLIGVERIELARHAEVRNPVFVALEAEQITRIAAGNRVFLGVPVAFLFARHHTLWYRPVDMARHHPRERALLQDAVWVTVARLDLLANKPVRDEFAVGFEPALAVCVDEPADRHVEICNELARLEGGLARAVCEFNRNARPEVVRNACGCPICITPRRALFKHGGERRSLEVEKREVRDLLLVELL